MFFFLVRLADESSGVLFASVEESSIVKLPADAMSAVLVDIGFKRMVGYHGTRSYPTIVNQPFNNFFTAF